MYPASYMYFASIIGKVMLYQVLGGPLIVLHPVTMSGYLNVLSIVGGLSLKEWN
jgi:hypothetical protein